MPSELIRGWVPVFPRDKREAFAQRSCTNKKIERDDDSKRSHPALDRRYWATVCTTLPSARALTVGSFMSLTRPSSYSASVCSGALARICTTL